MYKLSLFGVVTLSMMSLTAGESFADGVPGASMSHNPATNIVLEGRYANYDEGHFELEGFQQNSAHGIYEKGFTTGHNELNISADITPDLFGAASIAFEQEEGQTEVEIEEVYIESKSIGNGVAFKAGQFFSGIGIINMQHEHRQDFADAPLVYIAMFASHLVNTGVQLRWENKGDLNMQVGAELSSGSDFPGGENEDNDAGTTLFGKIGGKIGSSSSWNAGVSIYSSDFDERTGGGHHDDGGLIIEEGSVDVTGVDLEYIFSPQGQGNEGELKVQFEYFQRDEDGEMEYIVGTDEATAEYDGDQSGYYLQAVYRFMPKWRVGLRLDHLESDNALDSFDGDADGNGVAGVTFTDEDTGLIAEDDPERTTLMVDYAPNHNTVVRVQFMSDDSGHESEDRIYLQYVVAVGGAGH